MTYDYMDDEMKDLLEVMSKAVVPRNRRRAVFRTNWHAPYYSHSRYRKVA